MWHAEIIFRIEGFELPEVELPFVWPNVSIDGDESIHGSQTGWFYDGLTTNEEGELVYASSGLPVQLAVSIAAEPEHLALKTWTI